jgi:hypothetical protein
MNRVLSILYTLATVLIIVGALFILQEEVFGLPVLLSGLVFNIFYRIINLKKNSFKLEKVRSYLQVVNIFLLFIACFLFVVDMEQKYNLLIVSIVFDTILNMREVTQKNA